MCLGWLSNINIFDFNRTSYFRSYHFMLHFLPLKPCCQNDYYDVSFSETIIIVFMSENAAFSENTYDVKAF